MNLISRKLIIVGLLSMVIGAVISGLIVGGIYSRHSESLLISRDYENMMGILIAASYARDCKMNQLIEHLDQRIYRSHLHYSRKKLDDVDPDIKLLLIDAVNNYLDNFNVFSHSNTGAVTVNEIPEITCEST